jgi:hypothetical protein
LRGIREYHSFSSHLDCRRRHAHALHEATPEAQKFLAGRPLWQFCAKGIPDKPRKAGEFLSTEFLGTLMPAFSIRSDEIVDIVHFGTKGMSYITRARKK